MSHDSSLAVSDHKDTHARRLDVHFAPLTDKAALATRWMALEKQSNCSFFLSWTWICTWLDGLQEPPFLASITNQAGKDIALGLFCHHRERRSKIINSKQLYLHATGSPELDAITIEYNSLLHLPGHEEKAWNAILTHLHTSHSTLWDELIVPGGTIPFNISINKIINHKHTRALAPSYHVNLGSLRQQGVTDRNGYLSTLSRNTRSQLRRSFKLFEEHAPLALHRISDIDEAIYSFHSLGKLHRAKWQARNKKSQMENPDYVSFHERLIKRGLPDNLIDIICVKSGNQTIGWLYNFLYNDDVYFYKSGFATFDDNRLKPGLTTQTLAIEYYLQNTTFQRYDFMGGVDRYKESLGEPGEDIISYALQRDKPLLRLEQLGRKLKHAIQAKSQSQFQPKRKSH